VDGWRFRDFPKPRDGAREGAQAAIHSRYRAVNCSRIRAKLPRTDPS
jgi:hypothetical protein